MELFNNFKEETIFVVKLFYPKYVFNAPNFREEFDGAHIFDKGVEG